MAVTAGEQQEIVAQVPAGQAFEKWVGGTAWLKDPAAAKTSVVMPFRDIVVEAQFR